MNVLVWIQYIITLVYPTALPDTVNPSQANPVKKVVQIERVITTTGEDSTVTEVAGNRQVEIVTHHSQGSDVADVVVPLAFLIAATLMVVFITISRKQVNLAMIEKGMDPSSLKSPDTTKRFGALRFGLLLVGTSMGLLSGFGINMLFDVDHAYHEFIVITSALFFAGLSLIVYHMVAASLNKSH